MLYITLPKIGWQNLPPLFYILTLVGIPIFCNYLGTPNLHALRSLRSGRVQNKARDTNIFYPVFYIVEKNKMIPKMM